MTFLLVLDAKLLESRVDSLAHRVQSHYPSVDSGSSLSRAKSATNSPESCQCLPSQTASLLPDYGWLVGRLPQTRLLQNSLGARPPRKRIDPRVATLRPTRRPLTSPLPLQ